MSFLKGMAILFLMLGVVLGPSIFINDDINFEVYND